MKTEIDDSNKNNQMNSKQNEEEDHHQEELRRGPWTLEEDTLLIHHVACHGEGRWNLLAKIAGLKRTGKSCRLRWLNYLKPDIKRGNLSPQEQLLILELHSKWGNRWSKIAAHLPGRTDNEIKNYWRTRVQKQARQLNMECNSPSFIDAVRYFYMPRLVQKTEQNSSDNVTTMNSVASQSQLEHFKYEITSTSPKDTGSSNTSLSSVLEFQDHPSKTRTSSTPSSSSLVQDDNTTFSCNYDMDSGSMSACEITIPGCHVEASDWFGNDVAGDDMWDLDELWQFKK